MGTEEFKITKTPSNNVAVIFGATGLVGKELVKKLLAKCQWKVYGVARRPDNTQPIRNSKYQFISCDLLNPLETQEKLSFSEEVTHVFWVTWGSQFPLDSEECCELNKAMMSNALDAILPRAKGLKHFSLQTGTKHYISLQGPFDSKEVCYYNEECPRVSTGYNFYYVLEDLLKERLEGRIAWSVHRPGLIIGSSIKTVFNFMGSLCAYGSVCKYLNLPFVFGGTRECWEGNFIDGSDARLVAEQHIWAATNEAVYSRNGQAFNAINGPSFTWKEIWAAIGQKFGAEVPINMFSEDFLFSKAMADKGGTWREIAEKEGLVWTEIEDLANWEFLDILFRCPAKMLGTREKADRLGLTTQYQTLDSILYWIDAMRDEKLIP
ncbi:hypothetical protein LguiB_000712 [Lonicera macranthoides]